MPGAHTPQRKKRIHRKADGRQFSMTYRPWAEALEDRTLLSVTWLAGRPAGINNAAQILWSDGVEKIATGQFTPLPAPNDPHPNGWTIVYGAASFNDHGNAAGWWDLLGPLNTVVLPASWVDGVMYFGPTNYLATGASSREFGDVIRINNSNLVIGTEIANVQTGSSSTAFAWPGASSTAIDLGVGNKSAALGVNNLGHIVGTAGDQAFFYSSPGQVTYLSHPGATKTVATAINDKDQIVGYYRMPDDTSSGVIWEKNPATGAFTETPIPGVSWQTFFPNAINNSGQVIGNNVPYPAEFFWQSDPTAAFRWTKPWARTRLSFRRTMDDCWSKSTAT